MQARRVTLPTIGSGSKVLLRVDEAAVALRQQLVPNQIIDGERVADLDGALTYLKRVIATHQSPKDSNI